MIRDRGQRGKGGGMRGRVWPEVYVGEGQWDFYQILCFWGGGVGVSEGFSDGLVQGLLDGSLASCYGFRGAGGMGGSEGNWDWFWQGSGSNYGIVFCHGMKGVME